ncbi:MAG: hemerythrin domain-containing protein [Acidobacteriota bacterium]|nr:hemerythrin domain-containing protein [Acidobacteriota bacterium]
MLNAIELLTKQHREAQGMIERLTGDATMSDEERRALFEELKEALKLHTKIEEEVFYPALEDFDETRAIIDESYREHERVDRLLRRMGRTEEGAAGERDRETAGAATDWRALLGELRDAVAHHVGEEENDLFPRAARLLTPESLRDMGYEMRRYKTGQSEEDQLIYPASRVGPGA